MIRRYLWLAVQGVISVALLTWVFRGLDRHVFSALFADLPLWFYGISLAVVLGGLALYAWRWWLVLTITGADVPLSTAIQQYFIGVFVNNFLPSTVGGDMAKVYYIGRQHGYRAVAASVVVDRVLGVGILAILATGAAWLSSPDSPRLLASRLVVTGIAAALTVVVVLVVFGTGGLARWLAPLGPRAVSIATYAQQFRVDMAVPLKQPVVMAQAIFAVLTYFVCMTLVYLAFLTVHSIALPSFAALFTVVATTAVLSNVPISLNGLGVREQLHVWLLAPLGVPTEVALAISLLMFAHLLVASVVGLVLWLRMPALPSDAEPQLTVYRT
jgi:glycosyltransferase 2 family protein